MANNNNSAFRALYAKLVQALTRTGVYVGSTAGYPRVEIHSISETERLDKEGVLRKLSCVVDSMSATSLLEANTMNADNLDLIAGIAGGTLHGYAFDGVVFTQLSQNTEESDTQNILYRMSQGVDVYMSRSSADVGGQGRPVPNPRTDVEGQNEASNEQSQA